MGEYFLARLAPRGIRAGASTSQSCDINGRASARHSQRFENMGQCIDISNESLPGDGGWITGNAVADETESQLSDNFDAYSVRKFIVVKADDANGDIELRLGPKGNSLNGYILKAGETSPNIYLDDIAKVFIVGVGGMAGYSWWAQ
jgi:hypothetical protein